MDIRMILYDLPAGKEAAQGHQRSKASVILRCKRKSIAHNFIVTAIVAGGLFWGSMLPRSARAEDENKAVMSLLNQMESSYAMVNDYVAVFHKQERVNEKLLPEETILFKFQKPFKVYMKWIKEPFKDRETLYVQGENDNEVIAHNGGILGFVTVSLDPGGSIAMQGNRHPITDAGIGHMIDGLRSDIGFAFSHGELDIVRFGDEVFNSRPSIFLEARSLPRSGHKYYASHLILHIDRELMLPTGAAFYDEKDQLFERYAYKDLKVNVGLTAVDFSRHNSAYGF